MSECLNSKHTIFVGNAEESLVGQLGFMNSFIEGILALLSNVNVVWVPPLVANHPQCNFTTVHKQRFC